MTIFFLFVLSLTKTSFLMKSDIFLINYLLGMGGWWDGWLVGALPPQPRTVDLKVSEMSAFGPPRGCASGSLWVNINKKSLKMSFSLKMKVLSS
jgi:hypothetical protein